MNLGEKNFIREAFDLYRFGLQNRLLLENGQLSPYAYNNVLLIALGLGETVWARQFLDDWRPFLPEKSRENAYSINLAQFFFRTKNFESAMDLLQKFEPREPHAFLESRRMLLKIYWELGENEALDSLLESLRIYVYRKNALGYHRGSHLALVKILKKTLAAKPAERAAILEEARSMPALAEKEWIVSILKK